MSEIQRGPNEPRDNAVQCHSCAEVVCSMYRHDFKSCVCGDVAVDGGYDYNRRVFANDAAWTEVTRDQAGEWVPVGDED